MGAYFVHYLLYTLWDLVLGKVECTKQSDKKGCRLGQGLRQRRKGSSDDCCLDSSVDIHRVDLGHEPPGKGRVLDFGQALTIFQVPQAPLGYVS